ncbi:MAG: hypothetical protein HY430_04095 [Candidatus Levybacteria bacterium]|nr:hypothetical protein [Candidatus Levybacteria bacterium]
MAKILIGAIGIVVFLASVFLLTNLQKGESLAVALDDTGEAYGAISDDYTPCVWNATPPERVMSENKSQAILIQVKNTAKKECVSYLSLRAPSFDFSPAKEEQKIALAPKGSGSISWILTPRKTGSYEISVSDMLNTQIFGITVTNVFGLSAVQAKLFSIAGTLFGPMLTVPWWMDRWRQRKPKQEAPKDEGEKS